MLLPVPLRAPAQHQARQPFDRPVSPFRYHRPGCEPRRGSPAPSPARKEQRISPRRSPHLRASAQARPCSHPADLLLRLDFLVRAILRSGWIGLALPPAHDKSRAFPRTCVHLPSARPDSPPAARHPVDPRQARAAPSRGLHRPSTRHQAPGPAALRLGHHRCSSTPAVRSAAFEEASNRVLRPNHTWPAVCPGSSTARDMP